MTNIYVLVIGPEGILDVCCLSLEFLSLDDKSDPSLFFEGTYSLLNAYSFPFYAALMFVRTLRTLVMVP